MRTFKEITKEIEILEEHIEYYSEVTDGQSSNIKYLHAKIAAL